jgi:fungal STAND N-terminal Goodbye domain
MSSTPRVSSSNFELLFNAALARYIEQTGYDLRHHPLASKIESCISLDSLVAIIEEQAQSFDEFKNGDHKLIKWLQPIVTCLHALSTSAVLGTGVSLVRLNQFMASFSVFNT